MFDVLSWVEHKSLFGSVPAGGHSTEYIVAMFDEIDEALAEREDTGIIVDIRKSGIRCVEVAGTWLQELRSTSKREDAASESRPHVHTCGTVEMSPNFSSRTVSSLDKFNHHDSMNSLSRPLCCFRARCRVVVAAGTTLAWSITAGCTASDAGDTAGAGESSDTSSGSGQGETGDTGDDGAPALAPVQVFLMAGQSNMQGYGPLLDADTSDWEEAESLESLIASGAESEALLNPRDDVWVAITSDEPNPHAPGLLEPGFGATPQFLGPELGMGEVLGDAWETPVVMFKAAYGGASLGIDWRPPSAGGTEGPLYSAMLSDFAAFEAAGLAETFPADLDARGYELAGFVWLQGWNDQFEDGLVQEYEANLVALVSDVRVALNDPQLPAIIVAGPTLDESLRAARIAAVSTLESQAPGRVLYVETSDLVNVDVPGNFHFNFNAGRYLGVGRRTAQSILDMNWISMP